MRGAVVCLVGLVGLASLPLLPAEPAGPAVREGRLLILRQGETLGYETYRIVSTATEVEARAEIQLTLEGVSIRQTTRLLLSADYIPRRYEWQMQEPRKSWVRIEFDAARATVTYPLTEDTQDHQEFSFESPRIALLDNNVFHHYLLLAQLYDFARGGSQTIDVFVPQSVQPGRLTLALQGVETATVEGRSEPVRHFLVSTEDNQIELWVTESGRLVRLRASQQNIEVVAEPPAS